MNQTLLVSDTTSVWGSK